MLVSSRTKAVIYGGSLLAVLVPAAMQFMLFALYARILGVEQYGLYIALMSWSAICFELVGWGAGELLIKQTAQNAKVGMISRRHVDTMLLLTLPGAVLAFTFVTVLLLDGAAAWWMVAAIGLAEFVGLRLMVNAEQMALALGRFKPANLIRMLQVAPRLSAVTLAVLVLGFDRFDELALAGSLGMLAGGLVTRMVMGQRLPKPSNVSPKFSCTTLGTWFMGNQLLRASQQNIDRMILTSVVDPATLAIYSAAQRFVQLGLLPLQSVLRMTYAGFFEAGNSGFGTTVRYGLTVLPIALAAATIAMIGLSVIAPLLPMIIGQDFAQSVTYLVYLTPSLVLFALNATCADILSGGGFLRLRLTLTAAGVVLQAIMFWLMHDGLQTVLASYAGTGVSCLMMTGATIVLMWRERTASYAISST